MSSGRLPCVANNWSITFRSIAISLFSILLPENNVYTFCFTPSRAGLTGITWHTLRHTFASRLTRSGVDLVPVKELLGHSTINTTMRYAHSNHETKARAVAQLPKRDKL